MKFNNSVQTPRVRPTIETGPGLTEQGHKKECDINYILKDYQRTGLLKHVNENEGKYDDVSVSDFQEAMLIVKESERLFSELPSQARKAFDQDPAKFLEFVQNPENADKMEELGLTKGLDGLDASGAPLRGPITPEEGQAIAQAIAAAIKEPAGSQEGSDDD